MSHTTTARRTRSRSAALLLLLAPLPLRAQAQVPSQPTSPPAVPQSPATNSSQLRIRILNAQTNKPVTNEQLNVALRTDQIGSVAMPTDKQGIVHVDPGHAQILRILSNFYADCRPRGELYTNYPIADIRSTGITTGNLCSSAHPAARPGELVLFVIPRTYIPKAGEPPNTYLPHSDENPHAPAPDSTQPR